MFTGLIQTLGKVEAFASGRLAVSYDPSWVENDPVQEGESIAVNGCCLTALPVNQMVEFDLSPETLARTALARLVPGSPVNLERAMRPSDRFGGHIVQGHVDAVGEFLTSQPRDGHHEFRFRVPEDRYLIDKGSITLDGISLTVVEPSQGEFSVWVIPHTFENTTLRELKPGDPINVEYDMVAKYLEKLGGFR